jgi:hypothetical protein
MDSEYKFEQVEVNDTITFIRSGERQPEKVKITIGKSGMKNDVRLVDKATGLSEALLDGTEGEIVELEIKGAPTCFTALKIIKIDKATKPSLDASSKESGYQPFTEKPYVFWFGLAHWAKVNNKFTPKTRWFIYNIGTIKKYNQKISQKQLKYIQDIYSKAKNNGFSEM